MKKLENDKRAIKSYKPANLTEFFDSVEADIKSDLVDCKSMRRELKSHEVKIKESAKKVVRRQHRKRITK